MATVIGVRFKKAGKVYYFDPCEVWPRPGDSVVVETARGVEFGEVVTGAREVADEQIVAPLKKVVRIATEEDVRRAEYNEKREEEAFRVCQEKVAKHKLEMKPQTVFIILRSFRHFRILMPAVLIFHWHDCGTIPGRRLNISSLSFCSLTTPAM